MTRHNELIDLLKEEIVKIPFQTVKSNWDVLFDEKEDSLDDATRKERLDFLRTTRLSDIEYSNTEDDAVFTLSNSATKKSIQMSNRFPSNKELRGIVLRAALEKKKEKVPQVSVYDAIESELRGVGSTAVVMIKPVACGKHLAGDEAMSEEHYDLFVFILLMKINEKIQKANLRQEIDLESLKEEAVRDDIWKGIDIESVYDMTQSLFENFHQIQQKSDELLKRGYPEAHKEAQALYNNLMSQTTQLTEGDISIQKFAENCNSLLDQAKKTELQKHRGLFGQLWHQIQRALSYITFGCVEITPTDSMEKIIKTQRDIQFFLPHEEVKSEEIAKDSPGMNIE
ncbi:MAG: hypothetical protein CK426_04435 [Legionella sp.]|nr:MAG: hypothetical protein CK423_03685 [Legionella sp.]PJD98932.1 MAG: hypothetical protein CK426_04435 [Legionella sp.]